MSWISITPMIYLYKAVYGHVMLQSITVLKCRTLIAANNHSQKLVLQISGIVFSQTLISLMHAVKLQQFYYTAP